MAITITIDLRHVARGLNIPIPQVQAVVELLDEGNTVPFITRYRKDQTGGLDEEQIRHIQGRLAKLRQLADRKQTILRSIEAQGKLTDELAHHIQAAGTTKRLEDLYLPFKPRKQTLATQARARGLDVLAREILAADPACADLDARARDFVNPDRQVPSAADALLGAGHILAEQFSEMAELRQRLRDMLQQTGKIVSSQIVVESKAETKPAEAKPDAAPVAAAAPTIEPEAAAEAAPVAEGELVAEPASEPIGEPEAAAVSVVVDPVVTAEPEPSAVLVVEAALEPVVECVVESVVAPADETTETAAEALASDESAAAPVEGAATAEASAAEAPAAAPVQPAVARRVRKPKSAKAKPSKSELKKRKLEEQRIKAFRDYFDYAEELQKIPPHRVLAINRGERAKVLRVRVECNLDAMYAVIDEVLVPAEHPHADYLRGCARDGFNRLILPSLERELRRELTDRAETHAVEVFAMNLSNLLLQPPIRDRRVLAIDPGFKSGCKLAALDQFGNILEHAVIFLVGKSDRKQQARAKVAEMIGKFQLSVVAIGNGTGGREAEDFIASMIAEELQGKGVAYVVVNEAGASVYSTSRIGREEFPAYDASLRGAISIGRRLQDPLSELVKIEPANIGVGLYQHDVKAKHLETSLDEVVESCVNYVAVDVNTASPALLRYVSGLNQLTARRVYEHRREHGPFRNRTQLHAVPGFGDAAYVQAAGFLKITGGDNALDATWIHPESYAVAEQVLEKLSCKPSDLADNQSVAALAEKVKGIDRVAMAKELGVGQLTFNDILTQLCRPGRDPREDLPAPIFRQGVIKLEDLTVGMELTGTVLNVVDFGAFVDIGMHDSGLVHVSRIADRYIRDPHEVLAVGDIVKVWVTAVDKERRRVSLTMIKPGTERSRQPRGDQRGEGTRPAGEGAAPAGEGRPAGDDRQRRPEQARPQRPEQQRGGPQRADQQRGGPQRGGQGRPDQQRSDQGRGGQPSRGGGGGGRGGRRGPPDRQNYEMPKPKPAPMVPITDEMKKGKAPLRTFGDLLQFYATKNEGEIELPPIADDKKAKKNKKQGGKPAEAAAPEMAKPTEAPGESVAPEQATAAPVETAANPPSESSAPAGGEQQQAD